jgi:hypothetical protein
LISGLLEVHSGGRFPVFLVYATFSAMNERYGLRWSVSIQGINVSDRASGAGGDITISKDDRIILVAEITERPIDQSRVISTFNTKISTTSIEDYLFFMKNGEIPPEVIQQARRYFSQGYEVNFIEIKNWIVMLLATFGKSGRKIFHDTMISLIELPDVPKILKVKWNDTISELTRID